MKRTRSGFAILCIVGAMIGCTAASAHILMDDFLAITIQVSPNTIVLGLDKGSSVTVHTDIPYGQVDSTSVALNGVPAYTTFADACGDLVAKFSQESIEAIVAPPEALLTLTGVTSGGEPFSGSDCVRVIEDPSPGKS